MPEPFRVQFVPGVTPDKWVRIWAERVPDVSLEVTPAGEDPVPDLRDGRCSMCFVRLPVEREGLHVIPLYEELPVVVVGKDHPVAAFDEVDVRDLADEPLVQPSGEVPEWREVAGAGLVEGADALPMMTHRQAVSVVASGSGVLVLPLSLARLYHRKDVVHRPVSGVASTTVGLAWRVDDSDERIEAFVGIVRGRTERSSRGAPTGSLTGAAPTAAGGPRAKTQPAQPKRPTPGARRRAATGSQKNSPPRKRKRR